MISFEFLKDCRIDLGKEHKLWLNRVIRNEGKIPGNISYIFCNDEYMLQRNIEFLNHDTYTDIITFEENCGDIVSGSILISLDRVGENASKFSDTFDNELLRVLVHGALHLCGYKDKSEHEERVMRQKENEALRMLF